jgi:hypothetical protein
VIERLPPLREGESFVHWMEDGILWVEFHGYGGFVRRGISPDQAYYARFDLLREEIAVALINLRAAAEEP